MAHRGAAAERPTFAQDDLLAELQASGASVRATPVNQDRGPLYNLLISLAPVLLLFRLYYWLFRRSSGQLGGMGGLFGGGKQQLLSSGLVESHPGEVLAPG